MNGSKNTHFCEKAAAFANTTINFDKTRKKYVWFWFGRCAAKIDELTHLFRRRKTVFSLTTKSYLSVGGAELPLQTQFIEKVKNKHF